MNIEIPSHVMVETAPGSGVFEPWTDAAATDKVNVPRSAKPVGYTVGEQPWRPDYQTRRYKDKAAKARIKKFRKLQKERGVR